MENSRVKTSLANKVEKKLQFPMFFLTLVYLLLFALNIAGNVSAETMEIIEFCDVLIWMIFIVEFISLLALYTDKKHYLKTHWLNLLIVIIPSFRILRLVAILDIIGDISLSAKIIGVGKLISADSRFASAVVFFANALSYIKKLITKGKIKYIFIFVSFLVVFLGATASFFERGTSGANIINIYEGIWWGITSITTVGYGDRYPVTWAGRIIGVMLMTLGVTLFSLLTAEMSSFIIGRHEDKDKKEILNKLSDLEKDIEKLSEHKTDN